MLWHLSQSVASKRRTKTQICAKTIRNGKNWARHTYNEGRNRFWLLQQQTATNFIVKNDACELASGEQCTTIINVCAPFNNRTTTRSAMHKFISWNCACACARITKANTHADTNAQHFGWCWEISGAYFAKFNCLSCNEHTHSHTYTQNIAYKYALWRIWALKLNCKCFAIICRFLCGYAVPITDIIY